MIKHKIWTYLLTFLGSITFSFSQITPSDISDLLLWYDASDLTVSPGYLSSWNDKSGNNHDLLQPSSNNQPLKINNVIGDKSIVRLDRESTRLNSSHVRISYAVFCLKKKKKKEKELR